MRQARAGDETAFEALVRTHQDRAFAVALRMTGNAEDARDVTQDAFLRAWQGLASYREDAAFGTWLTRIVINRCHNLRRAARPTAALAEHDVTDPAPQTEARVEHAARHSATMAAVLALPFDQRAALVLHTLNGYSHAEVGRILGTSEAAAKVRVHRARRALIDQLQDWR
ncbi:RNA polymerase sigma-70 factor (ECF subfamily) [Georgenia soli]|uniref:RNA polymerase sigma-70 factor (ECF subfamily) n=1 Tax=Georgenia soli TaxID=638953 RepID=A0A2A9EJ54_9MICO|nr:RNA polymerase sigma-70 factor (ECF subfamily) [Georgenia soli]